MIGAAPVIERAGGEDAGYRHFGTTDDLMDFHPMPATRLLLMCGLPGAGKATLAMELPGKVPLSRNVTVLERTGSGRLLVRRARGAYGEGHLELLSVPAVANAVLHFDASHGRASGLCDLVAEKELHPAGGRLFTGLEGEAISVFNSTELWRSDRPLDNVRVADRPFVPSDLRAEKAQGSVASDRPDRLDSERSVGRIEDNRESSGETLSNSIVVDS